MPRSAEYAVVARTGDALEVLALCATAGDAVREQRSYPGAIVAYRDGRRWVALGRDAQ